MRAPEQGWVWWFTWVVTYAAAIVGLVLAVRGQITSTVAVVTVGVVVLAVWLGTTKR